MSCPNLTNPLNGMVEVSSGFTYESIAEYTCVVGYELSGQSSLACEAIGEWSASPPECNSKSLCTLLT